MQVHFRTCAFNALILAVMLFSCCERDEGWGGAQGERENAPWPPPISIVLPDETKGLPSLQATMANDQ